MVSAVAGYSRAVLLQCLIHGTVEEMASAASCRCAKARYHEALPSINHDRRPLIALQAMLANPRLQQFNSKSKPNPFPYTCTALSIALLSAAHIAFHTPRIYPIAHHLALHDVTSSLEFPDPAASTLPVGLCDHSDE